MKGDQRQLTEEQMLKLVKLYGLEIKENDWHATDANKQRMTLVCPDERNVERIVYKADGKQVILEEMRSIWIDVGVEWQRKCLRKELGIK